MNKEELNKAIDKFGERLENIIRFQVSYIKYIESLQTKTQWRR